MFNKIQKILLEYSQYSIEIDMETSLRYDLGIDSLAMQSVILDIEKEFEIEVQPHEINYKNFNCPRKIIDFIKGKSIGKYN